MGWRRGELELRIQLFEAQTVRLIEDELRSVARAWLKKHPRRRIGFQDTMGSVAWLIDGKALSGSWGEWDTRIEWRPDALGRVFAPLLDALDWYRDVIEQVPGTRGLGFVIGPSD